MAYRIKILAEGIAIKAFEILLRGRTPRSSESAEDIYMEELPSKELRKF